MYNVLSTIFEETMRREHHTASTFTSGEEFDCFFRRNNDNLNEHDTMVIYYRVDAPVQAGTLINFDGFTFLALNRETVENDVYYKSSIVRTNGVANTHSLSVVGLPFYSSTINNATATNSTNLSIIDGNAEVLTEDNAASRSLAINDLFNEWGRTWKITNLFFIDGICHIVMEINGNIEPTYRYKVVLAPLMSLHVNVGDTDTLTATAYINDVVTNAEITYSSSDDSIATIGNGGNIEYLAEGQVTFTAAWTEQGVSATTDIVAVQSEPVGEDISIYMEELGEIYKGLESDFSCYALKGGVKDDSIPVSVVAENVSGVSNQEAYLAYIKITNKGNGKFEVKVDNSNMTYKTFDLVASVDGYETKTRQTVKVVPFF